MASFSDPPAPAPPGIPVGMRVRHAVEDLRPRLPQAGSLIALALAVPLIAIALVRFGPSGRFAVAAFVIGTLCVLSAIDIAEHRLPNAIVLPSFFVVLVAQTALYPDQALEWALASVGSCLGLYVLHVVYPRGLGLGDVKLALLLGAALGSDVMGALLLGSLAAAFYAAALLVLSGGAARQTAFAFGPFLAFGAVVALLV